MNALKTDRSGDCAGRRMVWKLETDRVSWPHARQRRIWTLRGQPQR